MNSLCGSDAVRQLLFIAQAQAPKNMRNQICLHKIFMQKQQQKQQQQQHYNYNNDMGN